MAAELSRKSGRKIMFIANVKGEKLSFELKNGPLWDALEFLARYGKVFVNGTPFETIRELREKMQHGERVAINLKDFPVKDAVDDLSFVSGRSFRVKSGNPKKTFSMNLEAATLDEIISGIAKTAKVKIEPEPESASVN